MINGILQLYLAALFLVVQKTMVHLTIDGFLASMKSLDYNWFLNSLYIYALWPTRRPGPVRIFPSLGPWNFVKWELPAKHPAHILSALYSMPRRLGRGSQVCITSCVTYRQSLNLSGLRFFLSQIRGLYKISGFQPVITKDPCDHTRILCFEGFRLLKQCINNLFIIFY